MPRPTVVQPLPSLAVMEEQRPENICQFGVSRKTWYLLSIKRLRTTALMYCRGEKLKLLSCG